MKDNKKGFRKRFADLAGKKRFKMFSAILVVLILAGSIITFKTIAEAEQSGGSPNNNPTVSYIKQLYDHLKNDLSFGSDSSGAWGDWGAMWNRIYSAATWPTAADQGNATVTDVKNGATFYSTNRTKQTGTYPASGPCPTQQWYDDYGSQSDAVKMVNNCILSWEMASPAVPGDDPSSAAHNATPGNKDPRTGLVWSQYLKNTSGTNGFATSGGSTYSWDASAANNASRTAAQLCSDQGNGWRLPTQKELMQAYIDGSCFNLTNPSNNFWSVTEYSATDAWRVNLIGGGTNYSTKTNASYVRCVR